jgi:hypothetical protein
MKYHSVIETFIDAQQIDTCAWLFLSSVHKYVDEIDRSSQEFVNEILIPFSHNSFCIAGWLMERNQP